MLPCLHTCLLISLARCGRLEDESETVVRGQKSSRWSETGTGESNIKDTLNRQKHREFKGVWLFVTSAASESDFAHHIDEDRQD